MVKPQQIQIPGPARQIAQRLRRAMGAESVYLFGSHARGESGPDSDMDFAVILPDSQETRYRRSVRARGLVSDIHVAKDIVVLTRREWDDERAVACSLAHTVAREGIQIDG